MRNFVVTSSLVMWNFQQITSRVDRWSEVDRDSQADPDPKADPFCYFEN
jgi:hypothetical protein